MPASPQQGRQMAHCCPWRPPWSPCATSVGKPNAPAARRRLASLIVAPSSVFCSRLTSALRSSTRLLRKRVSLRSSRCARSGLKLGSWGERVVHFQGLIEVVLIVAGIQFLVQWATLGHAFAGGGGATSLTGWCGGAII